MEACCKAHEQDQDALKNHSPLKKDLGLNSEVRPPQKEAVKEATALAAPMIIPRPDHGLPGAEGAYSEDMGRDKCQDTVNRESNAKLRDRDKKTPLFSARKNISVWTGSAWAL